MSYDLAIWRTEESLSHSKPSDLYQSLCEGQKTPLQEHSSLDSFYKALISVYPELDSLTDDEADDVDLCPWSNEIDKQQGAFIVSCVFSKAEEVQQLVMKLAASYGLSVFDPQEGILFEP